MTVRINHIWSSLVSRLVVLLTIGMALVASLSLTVAQNAHGEKLARLRIESVVSATEDIATRLSTRPEATESLLAAGLVRDVHVPPPGAIVSQPGPKLTAALEARLGAAAKASGQIEPHEYCFPRDRPTADADTQVTWPAIPDCWLVRFVDQRGTQRALAIGLPRYLSRGQDLLDPIYLTLIIVLGAILAGIVAYFAIKPIRRLTRAAEAFSLTSDPEFLPETGPLEVRTAIATFNLMQRRVSEGHRERTGMLAAIGHDLQTPLTRLQLRIDEVRDAKLRARLDADIVAMQSIVREGLELARSSDNREPWSTVDIDSLVASIAEDAAELGAAVEIGTTCGVAIPTKVDAMTRCITNLVDNAVKYGGSARIDCRADADQLEIRISDNGPGIPPEDLERMFEPFARGEQSRSRSTGGTGLGLPIARAQAKLFGGDVTLENRKERGTVAIVRVGLR